MRIIVNGQQPFGAAVLHGLLDRGEEVVAVYCAPDREGRGPDPLKETALAADIPVRQPASFEGEQTAAEVVAWRPDLMVMAFVTILVPESVLDIPTRGTIQYHPSVLPAHRGPSAINWAIIHGDRTTGLTVFWPDEGLDTGPILLTKEVPIDDDDTVGSLYFDRLFPLGVQALLESVDLVREGRAPRVLQDEASATYEGWCRRTDVEIDWGAPGARVRDLVRGSNPRPGAWTTNVGRELTILTARVAEPQSRAAEPGEVLAVGPEGVVVATGDGALVVTEGRLGDGKRLGASDLADQAEVAVGVRLGTA